MYQIKVKTLQWNSESYSYLNELTLMLKLKEKRTDGWPWVRYSKVQRITNRNLSHKKVKETYTPIIYRKNRDVRLVSEFHRRHQFVLNVTYINILFVPIPDLESKCVETESHLGGTRIQEHRLSPSTESFERTKNGERPTDSPLIMGL